MLAIGVLPLTAAPTFLRRGDAFGLTLVEDGREIGHVAPDSLDHLAGLVATATTRAAGDDRSRRVEITLPAPGTLLDDLVLIDTPGIGSTDHRATAVARAALPECDAVLFVVSVDPPITEVETDHLAAVAGQTGVIVFVLNKADLVDEDERASLLAFATAAVAEVPGVPANPQVFAVSARAALRARQAGDGDALARSGLPALEQHLRATLVRRKRMLLHDAVARRLWAVIDDLERDALVEQRSLVLPLAELDARIERLDRADAGFAEERTALQDRFAGEWHRALAELEGLCGAMESRIAADLAAVLAGAPAHAEVTDLSALVERRMAVCFEGEFAATVAAVNAGIRYACERHRARYGELVAAVRQAASAIMDVAPPAAPPTAVKEVAPTFKPFWIGRAEVDSLGSLTADAFAVLLPPRVRRARERRRLREAMVKALRRNAMQLHWSAKQAIDDAFRALLASLPDAVEASLGVTRDIAAAARRRRQEQD